MLYKINPLIYPDFVSIANTNKCGKIYPLSIAEGFQEGDIFTNSGTNYNSVLFWAHSGFAYLSGKFNECFLEDICALLLNKNKSNSRRFLLMTNDEFIQNYFRANENIVLEKRYLFEYSKNSKFTEAAIPAGYKLKEIDEEILTKISGNISPSLFWKDLNAFLIKGKGYCITHNDDIASWAFSAAISSNEIDIGIETNPKYKQQGLGSIVAKKMIDYTINQQKNPVWACHYKNTASEKMAEKLGFVKTSECTVIKSKD